MGSEGGELIMSNFEIQLENIRLMIKKIREYGRLETNDPGCVYLQINTDGTWILYRDHNTTKIELMKGATFIQMAERIQHYLWGLEERYPDFPAF
jgi:hypothetical protein